MNELSGSIRKNKTKEKDTHPDYKGSALIEGVEYWISAWVKTGDDGPWLSLAFKPKEAAAPQPHTPTAIQDDLPF